MHTNTNLKKSLWVLLPLVSFYASDVLAVTASSEVQAIGSFLKESVINNVAYVGGIAGFIVTAVAAVGNKIGPIIMDNIGKIAYFGFGGTAVLGGLAAAGALIQ